MSYRSEVLLDNSNRLNGSFEVKNTGYQALLLKKKYYSDSDDFMNNGIKTNSDVELSNPNYHDLKKSDSTFVASFDLSKQLDLIDNKLYFNPYVVEFFSENPFILQERSYPVDFGHKQNYVYSCKLNLGEHYTLDELPESKKINLP